VAGTFEVLPHGTECTHMKVPVAFRDKVKELAQGQGMSMALFLQRMAPEIEEMVKKAS
jgi:hypothetical protein